MKSSATNNNDKNSCLAVACPECNSPPGIPCDRSILKKGRQNQQHIRRWRAFHYMNKNSD